MKLKIILLLIAIGFLIGIFSYWFIPYNDINYYGFDFRIIIAICCFIFALISCILIKKQQFLIATLISAGLVLAALLRIIYDTIFWDSTSHNLFPIELFIYVTISFSSSLIGVLFGTIINKLKRFE
jgi:hypothetical protein